MKLDDDASENCLGKFCFIAIGEEREDNVERVFEELYVETICMAKKNKVLKEQL